MRLSKCTGGDEYEAYISLQINHFARRLVFEPGVREVSKDIHSFCREHCISFYDTAERVDKAVVKLLREKGHQLSKVLSKQ